MQDTLHNLANRARGDARARQSLCEELESELLPLVRCALRRGTGLPALVSWVRGRFADLADTPEEPLDPRQAAPVIARLLCAGMVKQLSARHVKETVYGG